MEKKNINSGNVFNLPTSFTEESIKKAQNIFKGVAFKTIQREDGSSVNVRASINGYGSVQIQLFGEGSRSERTFMRQRQADAIQYFEGLDSRNPDVLRV